MSTELVHVFPCGSETCAGTCVPLAKEGRFYVHADREWLYIPLPTDMFIPRCNTCGRDWLTPADQEKVTQFLDESFREHAGLIQIIVDEYRARMAKHAAK